MVRFGGIAAAVIVLYSFHLAPGLDRIRSNARALQQAERDLADLRAAIPEVRRLESGIQARNAAVLSAGNAGESTLSLLTARVLEAGLPQASFSIKSGGIREGEHYKEESFDLKVENRSYLEIVRLISRIEDGSLPVALRSVNLKSRYENSSAIDAGIRIGFILPR